MLDLVDVFGAPPSQVHPPSSNDLWPSTQHTSDVSPDPWDTVGEWVPPPVSSHGSRCVLQCAYG